MKAQDARTKELPIPPSAIAEAGVWIVRLDDDGNNRTLKQGLRKWLDADPVNARAFEAANDAWEFSQKLRRVIPIPQVKQQFSKGWRALRWPTLTAMAASLALMSIAIIFFLQRGTFATGVGEQRMVALEDGTRVYLNTATTLVRRYDGRERLVELKGGEAYFDVVKEAGRPFIVRVGAQEVRALGTSFVVRRDARELAVTLVEGKVAVSGGPAASRVTAPLPSLSRSRGSLPLPSPGEADAARSDGVVVLEPGERLTFARTTRLARIDTPVLESVTAWRRGQVVLDKTPLANAIEEMNRYSTTKIVCEGENSRPCPELAVNGLFQAGDSEKFAHVVSVAYGLDVSRRGDEIVLSGTPTPAPGVRKP